VLRVGDCKLSAKALCGSLPTLCSPRDDGTDAQQSPERPPLGAKAIEFDGTNADAYVRRANAHLQTGALVAAQCDFETASKTQPDDFHLKSRPADAKRAIAAWAVQLMRDLLAERRRPANDFALPFPVAKVEFDDQRSQQRQAFLSAPWFLKRRSWFSMGDRLVTAGPNLRFFITSSPGDR
jgi:hypothetical protein